LAPQLEDFSFDMSGQQALTVLRSDRMAEFRKKHGYETPILVEGRVGIIAREDDTAMDYMKQLKEAGATGAIIAGAIAADKDKNSLETFLSLS